MKTYALSHQGYHRLANEDAYLLQDELGLYIVADGIGSMRESSIASDLIVQDFSLDFSRKRFADRFQGIKWELLRRHHFLYQQSKAVGNTIGATIALLQVCEEQAGILWAGDSRIYVYVPDHDLFMQITEDDVCGRAITRAVGVEAELKISQKIFNLQGGERFLLCTDGLYKKVLESEIHYILKHEQGFVACKKLIDLALARDTKDNITVMVIDHEHVA